MNFDLTEDQEMMRETFARFLSDHSSVARVRAALDSQGFDRKMWQGLAELGALSIRVPEPAGGLDLGIFDAGLLMEEAGRTLASGPLAEAIVATRLLALLDPQDNMNLRDAVACGSKVLTIATHDVTVQPEQLVAGGAVADAVIGRDGGNIVLVRFSDARAKAERTLASTPIARLRLDQGDRAILAEGCHRRVEAADCTGAERTCATGTAPRIDLCL